MVHARNRMACYGGLNDWKQMSTHIDTLNEWWENAEKGIPREGDTYIARFPRGDGYETGVVDGDGLPKGMLDDTRILARSPKPKPAWHDAAAVTATATDDLGDEITAVWVREGDELWRSDEGGMVLRDDLRDVTPLIEAKVTDDMIAGGVRGLIEPERTTDDVPEWRLEMYRDTVSRILHAALGIDPSA